MQNPHTALIVGQKLAANTSTAFDTVYYITKDGLADGYFGAGSPLARMCNTFKKNNPNTELHAIAVGSGVAGAMASGGINFSDALGGAEASFAGTYYLMINGVTCYIDIPLSASGQAIASLAVSIINDQRTLIPVNALTTNASLRLSAIMSGTLGNYINMRHNYYAGQSLPTCFSRAPVLVSLVGGSTDPDLGDAWAVIDDTQYHYIIQPFIDATNLAEVEGELSNRFGPMIDKQGHGFVGLRGTAASCTTLGNSRNSPYNTIIGAYDSPTCPEEWGAALGAVAAQYLNADPARPLQFLELKGVLAPLASNVFTRSERDTLLYDGIATWITDSSGKVMIERCITTYQKNALGLPDPSYLDIETLATLGEIRYQFKTRMVNRFIIPRFKLADDSFPVQPGSYVVTPKTIKSEIIALFTELQDIGLVENIDDFIKNMVIERSSSDVNRVNVLLPPDLVNQFRVLSGIIQFLL